MISIREGTFETNSSSCHSLTICNEDLKKKLENYEVLYGGEFEYDDDHAYYINEINPEGIYTQEEALQAIKKFQERELGEDHEYYEEHQWLKKHPEVLSMSLKEFHDLYENYLDSILNACEIYVTPPDILFGTPRPNGVSSDTRVLYEKVFLDPDTKEPVNVAMTCITC